MNSTPLFASSGIGGSLCPLLFLAAVVYLVVQASKKKQAANAAASRQHAVPAPPAQVVTWPESPAAMPVSAQQLIFHPKDEDVIPPACAKPELRFGEGRPPATVAEAVSTIIRFPCPTCLRHLKAKAKAAGKRLPCPGCGTEVAVPATDDADVVIALADDRHAMPPVINGQAPADMVPLNLRFPKGIGGVQVPVSRETANTVAKTVTGGLLVAIGIFIAAMLGIKINRS